MLLTIDLNTLISVLLSEFGPTIRIDLEEMSAVERAGTSEPVPEVPGLRAVRERIYLFVYDSKSWVRREDLEQKIAAQGQK